jgi:hypothetical protein
MLSCDKPCCSQATNSCVEHVAETYDDLITKENDQHKREVEELKIEIIKLKSKGQVQPSQNICDDMVKKLEKGSNLTTFAPQQGQAKRKSLVQLKKSNMEHKSTCSMESKNKKKPLRKKKQHARTRVCFKCKEKGHLIAVCHVLQNETKSDLTGQTGHTRPVGVQKTQSHSYKSKQVKDTNVTPKLKQVQSSKDDVESRKTKHHTFYTCRKRGI